MGALPARARTALAATALLLFAFASFYGDAFGVTSPGFFARTGVISEHLVLDGLLREQRGEGPATLGLYTRDGAGDDWARTREHYRAGAASGEFQRYESSAGLQLAALAWLARHGGGSLEVLRGAVALLSALAVVALFLGVARVATLGHGLAACLPLVLCPWPVALGANLYWVPVTWLLPLLLALHLGRAALARWSQALLLAALLAGAFALRFLCGYEFASTLGIAAVVPLAWFAVRDRVAPRRALALGALCLAAFLAAFAFATWRHAARIGPDLASGYRLIVQVAQHNAASDDPRALAEQACRERADPPACVAEYLHWYGSSLTADRGALLARYLLLAPHVLPWLDRVQWDPADEPQLRAARDEPSPARLRATLAAVAPRTVAFVASQLLQAAAFVVILTLVARAAWAERGALAAATALAALAPLSWLVLAPSHAANHFHLDYVLWWLPLIPCGTLLLYARARGCPPASA